MCSSVLIRCFRLAQLGECREMTFVVNWQYTNKNVLINQNISHHSLGTWLKEMS